jgi:ribosomal protein S18 acetylase RimI-like enzyme
VKVGRPREQDFDDVLDLVRAYDRSVIGDTDWTPAELREEWETIDLRRNAWVIKLDGRLAGYASVRDEGGGKLLADGYVHPEAHGRGVGARILTLTEARARELAASTPGVRAVLHNTTLLTATGDAANSLYESQGYTAVRHFWRMVIDLTGEPPPPAKPGDVVVEPYLHERDARAVHAAIQEAFADHWGSRPQSWDDWARERFGRTSHDPTLWFVARADGEIAGAILASWKRNGDWGYIDTLGVRRPWRRRGVAEALLLTAFRELCRRGERRVALGVDAESPTGATRLYERVGMRIFWRAVVWEKELSAAGGGP